LILPWIPCRRKLKAMSDKLLRAVVRGIDAAPKPQTGFHLGVTRYKTLIAILPPFGENFSVVWETREIEAEQT
jgi:hypothetical protein